MDNDRTATADSAADAVEQQLWMLRAKLLEDKQRLEKATSAKP